MSGQADHGSFSSRRGIAPMLWALLVLCAIEAAVTHLLLALWWPRVAAVLSLASAGMLIWAVRGVAGMRTRPSTVDDHGVSLRTGRLVAVTIPWRQIGGVRCDEVPRRQPGTLNLALVAQANVVIDCTPPLRRGRRQYDRVAHRLDDAAAFVAALKRLGAGA